jgi:hypothetical protein
MIDKIRCEQFKFEVNIALLHRDQENQSQLKQFIVNWTRSFNDWLLNIYLNVELINDLNGISVNMSFLILAFSFHLYLNEFCVLAQAISNVNYLSLVALVLSHSVLRTPDNQRVAHGPIHLALDCLSRFKLLTLHTHHYSCL